MQGPLTTTSKPEAGNAALVPTEVVGKLVAQGPLNLLGEQGAIVTEIAFEGVAIDDDPVFEAFAGDPVAEVVAVSLVPGAKVGDDHRNAFQHPLELLRQGVDRIGDERLEGGSGGLIVHA
jgi:hypothetical protein